MKKYKVWTGDGSAVDGTIHASMWAAKNAIRARRGHGRLFLAEHPNGGTWSVYGSHAARLTDKDGAFADTIEEVKQ